MVGTQLAAQYPHSSPWPGALEDNTGGCSVQGLGVANYGGIEGVYLAGDWCSGRTFGLGWDGEDSHLQEMTQTTLRFTAGCQDEDANLMAVNGIDFHLADAGHHAHPPDAQWRVMAADEVTEGAEMAETVQ